MSDYQYKPDRDRHLYRDPERGMILGVCAGLADAGGCPVLLVRIVALIALWSFTQATFIAYVVAALLLPVRPLRYFGSGDEASFWRSGRSGD